MPAIDETVTTQVLTPQDVHQALADTGMFKMKTAYLIIGDESSSRPGVVNLKAMMDPTQYDSLRKYLTMMPRSMLWNFFMTKIWVNLPASTPMSGLPRGMGEGSAMGPVQFTSIYGDTHSVKPFENLVWAAFVDMFNSANLEYINTNQLEPWVWEQQKLDAYYVSTSKTAIDDLLNEVESYNDVTLALDPIAANILEQYVLLPKIGDLGLEINRQNALKILLKKKDYKTAQAIVDAFKYIKETELGSALVKPIPFDVKAEDGSTIVQASQP